MRPSTPSRAIAALSALACASALAVGTGAAQAAPQQTGEKSTSQKNTQKNAQKKVLQQSQKLRRAVTVEGIQQHLTALEQIAEANDGNRASGEPGYAASRDYVVKKLRNAGYKPTVQPFDFEQFVEKTPSVLERTAPTAKTYTDSDFLTMEYSTSGEASGRVVPVDTALTATDASTSGCEAADFAGFPAGSIALMQRGTCDFSTKVANAAAAGAVAALVLNRGTGGEFSEVFSGTLAAESAIPALGLSFDAGRELGASGTTARVRTDTEVATKRTWNVLAETPGGSSGNVVMAGAHLDSVDDGAGINDNGSGSAAILEVAEQLAKQPQKQVRNKVRFAWWGAEESGLLGSYHYVEDLVESNPGALEDIAGYLNFDMVGSPNFVRFVYDGDNSTGEGSDGPEGSAQIEQLFTDYFSGRSLRSEPTAFDGRSDYGPFIENGVPAGGLFTGAEGIKTAREARIYGGTAGKAYDPCYHTACDDNTNISVQALDQMSDAVAHAVWTLARSTASLDGLSAQDSTSRLAASSTGSRSDRVADAWRR